MPGTDNLVDALTRSGYLTEPRWRDALRSVPREKFVPARAWAVPTDGAPPHPIDRGRDPDAWRAAVYTDTAVVTQLDDGEGDLTLGTGTGTSSASAPGMVAAFLELLDPYPGDQVLEIGTGTGWTAALLSTVLGADAVTSIEVDEQVARQAAVNLERAGLTPTLVTGDGALGWQSGALYDGVHATCGVREVPMAWVEQTRPGGTVVAPWVPGFGHGHRVRLTVLDDSRAVGRFAGGSTYMLMRAQRPAGPDFDGEGWREGSTLLDPRRVMRAAPGAHVTVSAMVPGVQAHGADGEEGAFQVWMWDGSSQARIAYDPGYARTGVEQRGPRDLWDEVERAYLTWAGWGMPGRDRFGLTVTAIGHQVWIDEPDNRVAPPP
ncbi:MULTISPECIES: methyltransferase domain-containing protein [Nocardiopsidaceae]|uniref:Protein-L-isoaspartate O-methyltransferase n=1 Tax=Streptomonospora nanhaiensis TaxID=1323731 RepID=A0ABY6YGS8_9ACTN|nr:protein-L-isoaspartate(D-aspartate) O-methyltransferase [Streptomonospora nanhaiensis]WAE71464.1 protein-L-isoaspartate(D-aspartate) O-methyltransferase [Streptomonospora nanhaiensis]